MGVKITGKFRLQTVVEYEICISKIPKITANYEKSSR